MSFILYCNRVYNTRENKQSYSTTELKLRSIRQEKMFISQKTFIINNVKYMHINKKGKILHHPIDIIWYISYGD